MNNSLKITTLNDNTVARTTKRYVKYPPKVGYGYEELVKSLGIGLLPVGKCIRLKKNDRGEFEFPEDAVGEK